MSLYDQNAWVLREISGRGCDLGPMRMIDFAHVFPDRASAKAFGRQAELQGFAVETSEQQRDEDPWDVIASGMMAPTCQGITEVEQRLDALARRHGGRSDGWGFLED